MTEPPPPFHPVSEASVPEAMVPAATLPPAARRPRAALSLVVLGALALGGGYLAGRWISRSLAPPAAALSEFDPTGATGALPVTPDSEGLSVQVAPSGWARLGEPAPGFSLKTPDGQPIALADFAGRPVVLNFWASWCRPCQAEMPYLESAYRQRADQGLVVLAVDVQEAPEVAQAFLEELGVTFPAAMDETGDVATQYRVQTLPTTYLIDRAGKIVSLQRGMFASEDDLARQLKPLLADES